MARVAALIPDLLFGSKVQAALEAAGHEVDLITGEVEAWDEVGGIDLLVVDLTSPDVDGVELFETLATGGELHEVRYASASSPTSSPRCASARWQAGSTWSCRARGWRARARSWSRGCWPTTVVERPRARETYAERL